MFYMSKNYYDYVISEKNVKTQFFTSFFTANIRKYIFILKLFFD